ncbi:PIN domain-containing protein [Sphingomonas lycopersici]|uniref:Type II toxin-antitoxin system VapC family toxin n=1 Tax=Sphingomonas lycopersici TaxID=2951807 RepID=A0AA42CUF7_9SPHN|nr:PIN domain-containing protein [Sphingomonas lycopersici]MCW6535401.1 hypothetical protein [Sphingomonas lycopersici]
MPLVGALLIAACAPTVRPFGDAPPPAAAQPPFSIGETRRADVADAVRDALHAAGYREAQDAPMRVEIGFAIRPPGVTVAGAGGATIVSPPAPRAIGLCRRQAYVLILALFDGRILPFDLSAARHYADLAVEARISDKGFPTPDGYIAAIAASRGFAVASRDTGAFRAAGMTVIDPWKVAPRS